MNPLRRLRDLPGVVVRDLPRYVRAIARSGRGHRSDAKGWISVRNRNEVLLAGESGRGVRCDWSWGCRLHAPKVIPLLGWQLMRAAFSEWPIEFGDRHQVRGGPPQLSFIFAHQSSERAVQLHQVIRSIFAQRSIACEVIVVDQTNPGVSGLLPAGVHYLHLDKSSVAPGWYKSWAYNVGARHARGDILVFHDGDVCIPEDYANEIVRTLVESDYDAASLQRFLFYLPEGVVPTPATSSPWLPEAAPSMVYQNWKGGTIAIRRDAFFQVGGFDEGFVDWGGEDDEFYDRCSALRHCRDGYIPFVHLWHPPQPDRKASDNPNIARILPERLRIPVAERIRELRARQFGLLSGPDPACAYKCALSIASVRGRAELCQD